jgi:hypothetical protein
MVDSSYNPQQQNPAIWVFLESENRNLEAVSLELLSKGRELADRVASGT